MISFETFKSELNEENINEMKKLKMPEAWAYKQYLQILDEPWCYGENIDVNKGIKIVIDEYLEGILYKEFRKYELDWE